MSALKESCSHWKWIYTGGVAAVIAELMWTLSWPPPKQALQSTPLIRIALRLNPPSSWTRQNQSESKPLGASALVGCHVLCSQETNNPLAVLNASNQQHFRCTPWNTPSVLLRSGACALSFSTWLITNKKQCDIWPSLWLYDMSRHGCISLQNNSTVTLPKSDFKQVWLKSLSSFSLFFSSFFFLFYCWGELQEHNAIL